MQIYTASCHCGTVKISFESEPITEALECNCSHCAKKGFLLIFRPTSELTIVSGDDHQTEYRFNKKKIAHLFCKTCGVQVFSRANFEGKEMSSINARTLEDFDIDTLTLKKVNGKDY